MAGLCWMALAFFLSAGDSLAAVDQSWLASVIEGIKNEYALGDTFSLAVNVPQNQDINDLQQVFQDDPADKVKQTVSQGQVYRGTRVVAAAQSQAVSRVLENIQPFVKSSQGNFLIIYSEKSPCGPTCTTNANDDSTSGEINDIIQNWSGYAFVFSRVVKVPAADTSQLSESFKRLGISKLGLDNIFRCYKPRDDPFQCSSCSSGGDVTPSCVANDAQSNQEQGVSESTGTEIGIEDIASVEAAVGMEEVGLEDIADIREIASVEAAVGMEEVGLEDIADIREAASVEAAVGMDEVGLEDIADIREIASVEAAVGMEEVGLEDIADIREAASVEAAVGMDEVGLEDIADIREIASVEAAVGMEEVGLEDIADIREIASVEAAVGVEEVG
ncbi:uncharacterized protein LOC115006961 [Cottoperca gobio]|uniref:Uncharacterized protein LOC115006961 n=1 Tax=Cottoperca gobio TaxID=56716 RepID=A0A6J2PJJ4_COTGO|nr:uncharacterized protein LOC115006961 [Cottoperca gobio]